MIFLSYSSFFVFLTCLFMGIIGLVFDHKSKLNQAFAFLTLILSFWAFSNIFFYISTSEKWLWFWYRIGSIGWCGMIFGFLYFCLVFSGYYKKTSVIIKIIMIFYPIVLIVIQFADTLILKGFFITENGTIVTISDLKSIGFLVYNLGLFPSVTIGIISVCISSKKSGSNRYKSQAKWIIITLIVSYFFGFTSNILSDLINYPVPPLGSMFIIILSGGIFYSIIKYRLLRIDYNLIQNEIADVVSDIILIISPDKKLIKLNKTASETLGIKENNIAGINVHKFLSEKSSFDKSLNNAIKAKMQKEIGPVLFLSKSKKEVLTAVTLFPIIDKFDDYIGTIIIGKLMNNFEAAVKKNGISPQETIIILHLMRGLLNKEIAHEMNISQATVKNYIHNIYKKTGSQTRVELLKLFFPLNT